MSKKMAKAVVDYALAGGAATFDREGVLVADNPTFIEVAEFVKDIEGGTRDDDGAIADEVSAWMATQPVAAACWGMWFRDQLTVRMLA